MVNHFLLVFILLPLTLMAGEFTASVNRKQVPIGESLVLNLSLQNATSNGIPALEALQNNFSIHSQQHLFNTVVLNGQVTTSTTWKVVLIPIHEGDVVIPSIAIDTAAGRLSTSPITIQVVKGGTSAASQGSDADELLLTAEVSNATPYKNESLIYTMKLASKCDLSDVKMQKIHLENAIIETYSSPKSYKKVVDGIATSVLELAYLITPLQHGPLTIPSVNIQGTLPIPFKSYRGGYDSDFNLFSAMAGFERLKHFSLTTEQLIVEVLPPEGGVLPWLPAKSLKIEEVWDSSQTLQEGEPFLWEVTISAVGIKSSLLPSVKELQANFSSFKMYADKPESGDEAKDGDITSFRREKFTLIPTQPGTLTLPELSITWWDVTNHQKVVARLPPRSLQVLPSSETALLDNPSAYVADVPVAPSSMDSALVVYRDPLPYLLIGGLVILLIGAILWAWMLQRKVSRLTATNTPSQRQRREKLPDLNPT